MEQSILKSTKKILGVDASYSAFDLDIITHINTAFSTLNELGIGPELGFMIEDDEALWSDFLGDDPRFNAVKTYVFLRVRVLFDPPTTGYLVTAMKEQIQELEWRLNRQREFLNSTQVPIIGTPVAVVPPVTIIDGGTP